MMRSLLPLPTQHDPNSAGLGPLIPSKWGSSSRPFRGASDRRDEHASKNDRFASIAVRKPAPHQNMSTSVMGVRRDKAVIRDLLGFPRFQNSTKSTRACLQLVEFYARTDPNQTENMTRR